MGKQFITEVTGASFTWRRDLGKIAAEAALDGIYVIRSSVTASTLDAAAMVSAYKDLKYVERDFRITKADDLDLRPIYHYLADRIRGHVLICMLACYLTWHLRQALAELTFTDQHIPPSTRSPPPAAQPRPGPKTPASTTATGCPSASTVTCSATYLPSTGKPSFSPGSASRSSPAPRPSRPGPSNCWAPPSRSPSSSHSTRRCQPTAHRITAGQQATINSKIK